MAAEMRPEVQRTLRSGGSPTEVKVVRVEPEFSAGELQFSLWRSKMSIVLFKEKNDGFTTCLIVADL